MRVGEGGGGGWCGICSMGGTVSWWCVARGGIQHSPGTPTTGLRERGNDTSRSTGCNGQQNAATRCNMRREDRVTVQGPVKEQQPDGMPHRGWGGGGWVGPTKGPLIRI